VNRLVDPHSRHKEPWRFGSPKQHKELKDRGYSDHFPVTVRLKVH
jgi:hypothetical protein